MQKTTVRGNNVDILELLFTSSVQCSNLYGNLNKRRVFSRSKMFIQNIIILLQIFRIQLWISIWCKDKSFFFTWRRASIYIMAWEWTARTYSSASIAILWIWTLKMTLFSSIPVYTWIWRIQRMNWLYLETENIWVPFNKSIKDIYANMLIKNGF